MAVEPDPPPAVPEWVVSFGDMMSLLLTFFIMLVSMSEVRKDDDKFQAFIIALKSKFGDDLEKLTLGLGTGQPSHTHATRMTQKRVTKWDNSVDMGSKQKAPPGNQAQVRNIRPGPQLAVGGAIRFGDNSAELTEQDERDLRRVAEDIAGKPQKVEIRGHTSQRPVPLDSGYRDHWDLAYARSRQVMQFLTDAGVDPRRMRISVAATNEPVQNSSDPLLARENARVEVFLLGEVPRIPPQELTAAPSTSAPPARP